MDYLHCFTFHFGEKRVEVTADSLIPLHSKMRHFIYYLDLSLLNDSGSWKFLTSLLLGWSSSAYKCSKTSLR